MRFLRKDIPYDTAHMNNFIEYNFTKSSIGEFDKILPCTLQLCFNRFTPAVLYYVEKLNDNHRVIIYTLSDQNSVEPSGEFICNKDSINNIKADADRVLVEQCFRWLTSFQSKIEKKECIELAPTTRIYYDGKSKY